MADDVWNNPETDKYDISKMGPEEAFRYATQQMGWSTGAKARGVGLGAVADWLNTHGQSGWSAPGASADDAIRWGGDEWDVIHGGDDAWQWYHPSAAELAGPVGGGRGDGMAGAPGPAGLYQAQWNEDPRFSKLFDFLMGQAQQGINVNEDDPIIRSQVNAYGAGQERSRRNYLQNLAESTGPNANIGAENRISAETVGQNTAEFQGKLMQEELGARRSQLAQYLGMMGNMLSDEQRMQLQYQLALMDNALGQANLSQRGYEFDVNDEFRRSPLAG